MSFSHNIHESDAELRMSCVPKHLIIVLFVQKAVHLIEEMDLDGNKRLSEAEILENQDLFLNSEATDYGRQLHDESFYHQEL